MVGARLAQAVMFIGWLVVHCTASSSKVLHDYEDVTITGELL